MRIQANRILVSRLRFLGDVILTTPLVRRLREVFPDAEICYLTEAAYAPVLANNPHLDEVLSYPSRPTLGEQIQFYRELRRRHFDLAIDLFGNPRTAVMTWISGAKIRVGGDFRGRGKLYNVRIPHSTETTDAISFHFRSLEALGIKAGDNRTELFLAEAEKRWANDFLRKRKVDTDAPLIGIHPGATWPNKRWPVQHFAKLADTLIAEGYQVLATQGPGEESIVRELQRLSPQVNVLPVLPIRQVAAIQRQCQVFVSNDCGIMHLAVAVETPTLGLFGPGQPEIWFPYDAALGHAALKYEIECRPCHKNYCPLGHLDCQMKLAPERVAEEVRRRIGQKNLAHGNELSRKQN